MALTNALLAFNSHLDMLVNTTFTRIAEVVTIALSENANDVDITSHDSTDRWRDFLQGLKDVEIAIEGNWLPLNTTQNFNTNGLLGLFDTGTIHTFKLWLGTGTGSTYVIFYAFIKNFTCGAMHDGKLEFSTVLRAMKFNEQEEFTALVYTEPWEYPTIIAPISEYTENWNYPHVVSATSTYTEPFDEYSVPSTLVLKYLEEWES
jgi:predicted secreted protein